jgi:hypothetical protein
VAPADADRSRAGVEPERLRFPWWRGPRTEAAGFTGTTWPVTSQSNQVLPGGEEFQKAKAGAIARGGDQGGERGAGGW